MKVMFGIGKVKSALKNTVAAIGVFDGVHKGHQELIRKTVASARRNNAKSLVVTFHPHPVEVLHKRELSYLVSLPYRLELIKALGVDYVLVITFTRKFAQLKPEEFVKKYLVKQLGVREVFVGDDFRFGENRSGDVDLFTAMGEKHGFQVNHMHLIKKISEADKISSSRLRELISAGKLHEAASMLGRPVSVMGQVIRGDGRGKTIGYPTANLQWERSILPPRGVYIVQVHFKNRCYQGMANIGVRPSFQNKNARVSLEVHILNFKKNIYDKPLIVEFLQKIRDEQRFPSVPSLVDQIRLDEQTARRYFRSHSC